MIDLSTRLLQSDIDPFAPEVCAIPVPHEESPAATAKAGVRRTPQAVRRLVESQLTQEQALRLVQAGEMEDSRVRVVWRVGASAVIQRIESLAIPDQPYLVVPVRRVGTYEGARSRIAMYPTVREGRAFMLTVDSGLELAWAQTLDMHPDVSTLYAQPFMLIWDHEEGSFFHVPDLAAVIDGRLVVFEVKPSSRMAKPWIEARTGLAQRSFARWGARYHLLSDVTQQRAVNLRIIARHRRFNPFVAPEVRVGLASSARTVGGLFDEICRFRDRQVATPSNFTLVASREETGPVVDISDHGLDQRQFASIRIAMEVVKHLLATGHVYTDLDQPLRLSSVLSRQRPDIATWSRW